MSRREGKRLGGFLIKISPRAWGEEGLAFLEEKGGGEILQAGSKVSMSIDR